MIASLILLISCSFMLSLIIIFHKSFGRKWRWFKSIKIPGIITLCIAIIISYLIYVEIPVRQEIDRTVSLIKEKKVRDISSIKISTWKGYFNGNSNEDFSFFVDSSDYGDMLRELKQLRFFEISHPSYYRELYIEIKFNDSTTYVMKIFKSVNNNKEVIVIPIYIYGRIVVYGSLNYRNDKLGLLVENIYRKWKKTLVPNQ